MDHLSIRITQRAELGDKSTEKTIEIDTRPDTGRVATIVIQNQDSIAQAIAGHPAFSGGPKSAPEPDLVPGEPADLQEALQAISLNLGCQNTLDDMLHAIDALRGPQPEWSPTLADGERVDYEDAEAAIAKLNASLPAGEAQWRMPSRRELESIQDLTKHNPCVDLEKYPDTKPGYYWSSTPCAWSSDHAWYVGFYYGDSNDFHRDDSNAFVRAVRAVPSGQ